MRPICYRRGTLVLEVPDAVADATQDIQFRSQGAEWAVLFLDRVGGAEVLACAAGTYRQEGAEIHVTGGAVAGDDLPDWFLAGEGEWEWPEDWANVARFGRSGTAVRIGEDG